MRTNFESKGVHSAIAKRWAGQDAYGHHLGSDGHRVGIGWRDAATGEDSLARGRQPEFPAIGSCLFEFAGDLVPGFGFGHDQAERCWEAQAIHIFCNDLFSTVFDLLRGLPFHHTGNSFWGRGHG